MDLSPDDIVVIEQQLDLSVATVQVARLNLPPAAHATYVPVDMLRLDLCLTPRPAGVQARYSGHWASHRFEDIGRVFALPPDEAVDFKSAGGHPVEIICEIQSQAVREWIGRDIEWTSARLASTLDIANDRLASLLYRAGEELRTPSMAQATMMELLVGQMAIEFGRHFLAMEGIVNAGGLSPRRLRLIDDRLEASSTPPSLGELAALCDVSVRQLTRGFFNSRGRSVGTYIAQRRIDRAKRLLTGELPIKTIAYELGFASPSVFSQAFRRATGGSPFEYRMQHRRRWH